MKLFYIKFSTGVTFAIVAKDQELALEKSLKYGQDGIIISSHKLNNNWN